MSLDDLGDELLLEWFTGVVEQAASRYPMTPTTEAYGAADEQVIDWWGDATAPVVVVSVHGGYFAAEYDRSVNEPLSRMLASLGLLVANIDYRRTSSCDDPMDTVADVRAAIGAVVGQAAGRPVVVVGHSAGGYLTVAGSTVPGVTGALPLSPATNLAECCLEGWDEGAIAAWIGCHHTDDPARWDRMELSSVGMGEAPMVVLHGVDDRVVFASQSEAFVAAHPQVRLELLPGTGHYEFLDPESEAARRVAAWVDRLAAGA